MSGENTGFSLASLFNRNTDTQQQAAPQQQQAPQQQGQPQQGPMTQNTPQQLGDPNNVDPNGQPNPDPNAQQGQGDPTQQGQPPVQGQPVQQQQVDPLDPYKNLWNNASDAGEENKAPALTLNPETITKAAGSLDFTKGIDPELLSKATQGDSQAMLELLNGVAQAAYSQSIQHGTALTNDFVGKYTDHQLNNVAPSLVRDQLTSNELQTQTAASNLDFSNPVVKAHVAEVAKQLALQHPTASPAEVAKLAQNHVVEMAATILGANAEQLASLPEQFKQQQEVTAAEVTDWDEWVNN